MKLRDLVMVLSVVSYLSMQAGVKKEHIYVPISWVRDWGKGRVFYCSLGHDNPSPRASFTMRNVSVTKTPI